MVLPNFSCINDLIIKKVLLFSFQNTMGRFLPLPQVLKILKPPWRYTNAQSSGRSRPGVEHSIMRCQGAAAVRYPVVIDRVGLCRRRAEAGAQMGPVF